MFFTNDEHKRNYYLLMKIYNLEQGEDAQYESTIYVAAYPGIFKAINIKKLSSFSPLLTLTRWNKHKQKHEFVASSLTGATRRMCEFAFSLYNGYEVSLDDILGSINNDSMIRVLFESLKIRSRKLYLQ